MYFHSLALQEGWLSPLFFCVTVFVERRRLLVIHLCTVGSAEDVLTST